MLDKPKKFLKVIELKNKQRSVDKQIEKEGFTDEVLEAQIEINKERSKHDIADSKKYVHEKFVQ